MTAQRLKGKKKGSHKPLTFKDMMQIGLGVLRYSPSVFYELTLQQLMAAMKGAADAEERAYQQQWTQTSDLCTFPWEQKTGKEVSKEEGNKMQLQALQKYFKNGTA